jgi:hypothetical protein
VVAFECLLSVHSYHIFASLDTMNRELYESLIYQYEAFLKSLVVTRSKGEDPQHLTLSTRLVLVIDKEFLRIFGHSSAFRMACCCNQATTSSTCKPSLPNA